MASDDHLSGRHVFLVGRLHGLTRARIEHLLAAGGGRLVRKPSARVNVVVLGHTASSQVLDDGTLRLPAGLPRSAVLVSERAFRRQLGLPTSAAPSGQSMPLAEVQRLSGLEPAAIATLSLFDILGPANELFGYRDLVAAREVARLRRAGLELHRIVHAGVQLGRRGLHLSETRLLEGPSGELFRDVAGAVADLSGQLTMPLGAEPRSVDELFAAAEAAEDAGRLAAAEGLYSTALRADQDDPVLPFNLGNVFDAQGRAAEAKIAWQIAVARDPGFGEAWYNLAVAAEEARQDDLAVAQYRRALQARPDYLDASHNLALLLTRTRRYAEALPLWDALLADGLPDQKELARRAAALCRMELKSQQVGTG